MPEVQTVSDNNWQEVIGTQPALILLTTGDGLRSDFSSEFKRAAQSKKQLFFAQANPNSNPQLAERFNAKEKPVLIGYFNGEALVRRVRPWGSDVVLTIELLESKAKERQATMSEDTNMQPTNEAAIVAGTPVVVTDADFQEKVIEFSKEQPVLVDFWAEWCGPCKMVAPIMEKLAAEYEGQIRIAKVDTDENQALAQTFRIMSIPTIQVWKDGELVFSQPGAFPEAAFRQLLDQVIALDVQAALAEARAKQQADSN